MLTKLLPVFVVMTFTSVFQVLVSTEIYVVYLSADEVPALPLAHVGIRDVLS